MRNDPICREMRAGITHAVQVQTRLAGAGSSSLPQMSERHFPLGNAGKRKHCTWIGETILKDRFTSCCDGPHSVESSSVLPPVPQRPARVPFSTLGHPIRTEPIACALG